MVSSERSNNSRLRGIYFAKIGATITEISQPLYIGLFFKILKRSHRNMTSIGRKIPLNILVAYYSKIFVRIKLGCYQR